MTSTKAETINSIYSNLDLQKQESTTILESLLEIMKRTLGIRRRDFDLRVRQILCESEN